MTNKILLLIGKCLIVIGLMWPVPCAIIFKWIAAMLPRECVLWDNTTSEPIFEYISHIPMSMWGIEDGYWWPILAIIGLGILICAIASIYGRNNNAEPVRYVQTPLYWLYMITKWCMYGVIVFHCIALFLIGVVYVIGNIDKTGPYVIDAIVFGVAIGFGLLFYDKYKKR